MAASEKPTHDAAPPAEPMTPSLMGRLFLVPAVLVSMMVVGLIIVVGLFGLSAVGQRPTVAELLAALEAHGGERQAGALFPQSKEVWLAAQELAERLRKPEAEFKPEELAPTAERLKKIYEQVAGRLATGETLADSDRQKAVFTLLALARLHQPQSAEVVAAAMTSRDPDFRKAAIRGAVDLRGSTAAGALVPALCDRLDDELPEVRLMACAALGQVAEKGERAAIEALASRLRDEREVQWNAALALARLGSTRGKMTLLPMLDRTFWDKNQVEYSTGADQVRRPFTPRQIESYLVAAVEAAAPLNDAELNALIQKLSNDPSPVVRDQVARCERLTRAPADAKLAPARGDAVAAERPG